MEITHEAFVKSSADVNHCPNLDIPEYAFIGRSNVGKSSLINMLTNKKNLAKTSGKPGKTQLINHFLINESTDPWYLVDLPGYGFAKAPKKEQDRWLNFVKRYLTSRENLMCVMVLLDSRHAPIKADLEFMEWLGAKQVPFVMVFTKIDKLGSGELNKNLTTYKRKMLNKWEYLPEIFETSASKAYGKKELLEFFERVNKDYWPLSERNK